MRRTVAVVVSAAALSALLFLPVPAHAGEVSALLSGRLNRGMASVVAPARGAVATGATVPIRVRVGSRARSVRAWLDGREFTGSLRRAGGERVATLRAPVVHRGVNHLYVRVRDGRGHRDFDVTRFVWARRATGLLAVSLAKRRARSGRLRARVALAPGARLRGTLNGRRLGAAALGSGRRRALVLDADEGLRFGANRLRLLAFRRSGRYDVERRQVLVPRTRPIPAAGKDRRAEVKRAVRLDARPSRAAHPGRRLGFTWRIVRRPKRSKATLAGRHRARPALRPDRVGTYRVRLEVRELSAGRTARSASASPSSAVVTIAAEPDIPAGGVPIDTIEGGGVTLGAPVYKTYAASDTAVLQLVVLDRQDLGLVANNSYGGDAAGTGQLLSDVQSYGEGDLAIIATPPQSQPYIDSGAAFSNLNAAIEDIGGQALQQDPSFGLSVVGVPGLGAGNGGAQNEDLGDPRDQSPGPGNLNGFLRKDSSKNYSYVDADYVPFTTVAPGTTPTQAVISVGGNSYSSANLGSGQGGFFVLLLDAGTLERQFAATFVTSGPGIDASNLPDNLSNMDQVLSDHLIDPTVLIFIQSIGTVDRGPADQFATSEWNQLQTDQTALGGHGYYLTAADGGSYAFTGPGNASTFLSPWAQTASQAATGGLGQLSGVLGRNPLAQYYPKIAGTQAAADVGLPQVAYAQPVPWPYRDAAHQNALECVASATNPTLTLPIEDNYTNTNIDWDSDDIAGALRDLEFGSLPATPACQQDITEQQFDDVKGELLAEWGDVPTVQKLIANLQSPLLGGWSDIQQNFEDVVQAVYNAVSPGGANANANSQQLVIDLLWIASYAPFVGDAAGLTAGVMQLALDDSNNANGSPAVSDVQTEASELADALANDYQAVYSQIAVINDVLVGDAGMLQAAADHAASDWAWDPAVDYAPARDAIITSMKKLAFESLFPTIYTTYLFGDQQPSDARDYTCYEYPPPPSPSFRPYKPFANEPEGGTNVIVGAGPENDLFAFGRIDEQFLVPLGDERTDNGPPPQSLYDDMFSNPAAATVQAPPLPSPLRFDLDAYVNRPLITHDKNGVCLVNGVQPQANG